MFGVLKPLLNSHFIFNAVHRKHICVRRECELKPVRQPGFTSKQRCGRCSSTEADERSPSGSNNRGTLQTYLLFPICNYAVPQVFTSSLWCKLASRKTILCFWQITPTTPQDLSKTWRAYCPCRWTGLSWRLKLYLCALFLFYFIIFFLCIMFLFMQSSWNQLLVVHVLA